MSPPFLHYGADIRKYTLNRLGCNRGIMKVKEVVGMGGGDV